MNKKPGLLFTVSLLAIIILAASFNMNFGGNAPVHLRAGINPDNVLYVCPATSDGWNQFSTGLHAVGQYAHLLFAFIILVLMFSWGWALYQNLLKDKFSADVYKKPWELTKSVFWGIVIFTVVYMTPNYYRTVHVRGARADYVLCESTSTGARAVNPSAVSLSEK